MYSEYITKKNAGKPWGTWKAMNYFTAAIGAMTGGYIAFIFGFHTLFILMGALCFASAIYIYFLPDNALKKTVPYKKL